MADDVAWGRRGLSAVRGAPEVEVLERGGMRLELPDSRGVAADPAQHVRWLGELRSGEEESRFRAALALGTHQVREARSALVDTLQDLQGSGDHLRIAAAIALGRAGDPDVVYFLLDGLFDPHPLVRTAVDEALTALTGHEIDASKGRPADVPPSAYEQWSGWSLRKQWQEWWRENKAAVRKQRAPRK